MKLKEHSKTFNNLLYIIWVLLDYYASYFGFDAEEAAHKLKCRLIPDGTLTKIRVSVPMIKALNPYYTTEDIRIIMSEYLELMLPEYKNEVPPFVAGTHYIQQIGALQILDVTCQNGYYHFTFLYVDNMDAYRLVTEGKKPMMI